MSKQDCQTNSEPAKPPKLVGVYLRPREEHWAELLASVDSAQAALDEDRFAPDQVRLPSSRMQPVYETMDGQRVLLQETPGGFVTRTFNEGPGLEAVASGGLAGGFMSTAHSPPLPLAAGTDPAVWASGYTSRVPEHVELGALQESWAPATQDCTDAVDARTSPEQDEGRRQYFTRIRETAAKRDPLYRSPTAAPKGPGHFTGERAWSAEEYHDSLFKAYTQTAEQARQDSAHVRTAAPEGVFEHLPQSRLLALGGAIQKNGPGLAALFHQVLEPEVSARIGAALQAHLREQAQAQGGKGQAVNKLRAALEMLKKLNGAGGGELLAGMLENLAKGAGQGSDLAKLKGDFIKNLAQMGLNQGLEQIIGSEAASFLAGTGVTGLFADAAKNVIMDEKPGLVDGAEKLLADLPNKLIDMGFDKLLGQVDDRSSMAKQLLAKYKDQIKGLLKKLLSPGGLEELQKKWDAIWKGMPSKAKVKVGLAIGFCAPDLVMVNGLPVTRVNDECIYPPNEPPGKFFQGNPTITVNGMWPAGEIHAAINGKGTIATPMQVSPNVLMGEATVSVKVKVRTAAPCAAGTEGQGAAGASASGSGPEAGPSTSSSSGTTNTTDAGPPSTSPEREPGTIPPCPPTAEEARNDPNFCRDLASQNFGMHGGLEQHRSIRHDTNGGNQCVYNPDGSINKEPAIMGSADQTAFAAGKEPETGECTTSLSRKIQHGIDDAIPCLFDPEGYNAVQECMRERGIPSGTTGAPFTDAQLKEAYRDCHHQQYAPRDPVTGMQLPPPPTPDPGSGVPTNSGRGAQSPRPPATPPPVPVPPPDQPP